MNTKPPWVKHLILYSGIVLSYLALTLFFFRGVIFSPGIISGGDWGLPFTQPQMFRYFESGLYTWTDRDLFGIQQFLLNSFPFQILTGFLAKIGITGGLYIKLLLILAFVFPASAMYLLCRFLNCQRIVAAFGGLLYITLPFFFNYAAIGWLFILYSMGILPLALICFIKSVKEGKIFYSILTGILYFLAMIQSQSLVWYPLVFLSLAVFLINNKKSLLIYLRSLLVIFFIFLGMSAFWGLPLFLGGESGMLKTRLGLSSVSLGTGVRLSNLNILRAWGSLFNYQYESSYPQILTSLSFLLPFLAYSSLLFLKRNRIVYSLALLSFVPVIIFKLGPGFIVRLPFADLMRDLARFSVISSFSYVILASLVLNFMWEHKRRQLKIIVIIFSILLAVNAYPFWRGELFGEPKQEYDVRLRTYNFSPEYFALENNLTEEERDIKILYLPLGGSPKPVDDPRFYGMFKGMRDFFASYSSKPGVIGFSDKEKGSSAGLILKLEEIQENHEINKLAKILNLMNVKYIAVRKNVEQPLGVAGKEMASLLSKETGITLREDGNKISLFENNEFLPHFYTPQSIVYARADTEDLFDIVGFLDSRPKSGVYLEDSKLKTSASSAKLADSAGKENSKLKNSGILEWADEVFVKANLENPIDKDYFGKKENFKNSVSFPYAKHKPGSFWYPLALKREQFAEWRVKKNPEDLLGKKLFYAGKRISELEKFGVDDADRKLITQIMDGYQFKMEEAIGLVKNMTAENDQTEEMRDNMLIKLRAYREKHKEKAEEIYKDKLKQTTETTKYQETARNLEVVFDQLNEKIKSLEKKFDWQNLEYNFEIPKKGGHELFIKADGGDRKLITQIGVGIDGEIMVAKTAELNGNEWVDFGKREFPEGRHNLVLRFPGLDNLVRDNWQEFKTVEIKDEVKFSSQGFFPDVQNLIFQEIGDWQKDDLYYLTFDYKTEEGNLGVGILEEKFMFERGEKSAKTEKIFEKRLQSKINKWEKFEAIVTSSPLALGAKIYLYSLASPSQFTKVDFRNLKIFKIVQPKIILKFIKKVNEANFKKEAPRITFVKINPTKYKVKVEGGKNPYTLVFSESFHQGWKAYIRNPAFVKTPAGRQESGLAPRLGPRGIRNQEDSDIIASYFDGEIKEGKHKNIFLDETTFETWGKKPLPENRHIIMNGYANAWYITPENAKGKENYEIVIEFWPQRLFYIGLGISVIILLGCLGYLGYSLTKNKWGLLNDRKA